MDYAETVARLAEAPTRSIRIDRSNFSLTLYDRKEHDREWDEVSTYPIAIGLKGYFKGLNKPYMIISKAKNPDWQKPDSEWVPEDEWGDVVPGGTPENPLGTRWMGIDGQGHGIHGTNAPWTLGTASSHGCFRMRNEDVEELYRMVDIGTAVAIQR